MGEFTTDIVARLVRRVLFDEWRSQIAAGYLTETGLLAVRARLNLTNEFVRDAERDLMLMEVAMAIAASRGADSDRIPGSEAPGVADTAHRIE